MSVSVVEEGALVAVEVRTHVDGDRHTVAIDEKQVGPGPGSSVEIPLEALGVHSEIEFAASVEGTVFVTREGHTRTAPLETIHIHPVGEGFLVYGSEALETQYNGGDFRGVLPVVDDPETETIAHVSVAQVRVLAPGEETELE